MTEKHEYHEGSEALDRFGRTMTALFRVPKGTVEKEPAQPVCKAKIKNAPRKAK